MKRALWILAGLALGGLVLALTGIVPIKASSGHWAITEWFLHTVMRRSISTHSIGVPDRPLDDPALVLKGAGHFESACKACHGAPGEAKPRVVQEMTPAPPHLPDRVGDWENDDLFYVIKHGVKFTGMPAWPAKHRDDEVWAMVAFVRTLPRMTPEEYRSLVHGAAPAPGGTARLELDPGDGPPREVLETCARCHGARGEGRGRGAYPRLAGQSPEYLYRALLAYADGRRHSGMMQVVAAAVGREGMRELARYYGRLDGAAPGEGVAAGVPARRDPPERLLADPAPPDGEAVRRGREIALHGVPERKVPSCADCHGPGEARRNPAYPRLAGQYADYLVLQLELFQKGHRGGSAYRHLMREVAPYLTKQEMRDVALYYAGLPWEGRASGPGEPPEPVVTAAR